jgi:SRSO17 transposase
MERRFAERKEAMLAECEVLPQVFAGVAQRLAQFVEAFAARLRQPVQREHATDYVSGLLSDLECKNVESIAYRCDQDRRDLQHFIGCSPWDHRPLLTELARQVGQELGEDDGVIVFDPSAFPKKGAKSVGVQRQWCGRLGKVDNCQVAVYMAYVSRIDHALVNARLYLPQEWAKDRARRKAAGVPKDVRFQTRHAQALEMLAECGAALPHAWIAGDDEMGRSGRFRLDLHALGERYLLAVPCDTLLRDLDAPTPEYGGRGRLPKTPFQRVDQWRDALSEEAWARINVRDGDKGPLEVEVATCRVRTKSQGRIMKHDETLVVVRSLGDDGATKYDFYVSNALAGTTAKEFARVALAAHRIEEAIKRGKSEAGLSHYEVRHWLGWHHHQTLSLIAAWFLVREALRGKKMDSRDDRAADPRWHRHALARAMSMRHAHANRRQRHTPIAPQRTGQVLSLQST